MTEREISPQLQRALEVLADGRWHDYREVVSKMASTVPPGIAARRAERNRRARAIAQGYSTVDTRQREMEAVDQAWIGAKAIARQTLVNNPHFEIEPRGVIRGGVTRRVRLRPGVVSDEQAADLDLRSTQGG